jgi:hypothetical protein
MQRPNAQITTGLEPRNVLKKSLCRGDRSQSACNVLPHVGTPDVAIGRRPAPLQRTPPLFGSNTEHTIYALLYTVR